MMVNHQPTKKNLTGILQPYGQQSRVHGPFCLADSSDASGSNSSSFEFSQSREAMKNREKVWKRYEKVRFALSLPPSSTFVDLFVSFLIDFM